MRDELRPIVVVNRNSVTNMSDRPSSLNKLSINKHNIRSFSTASIVSEFHM
jgi:hypothetical protein